MKCDRQPARTDGKCEFWLRIHSANSSECVCHDSQNDGHQSPCGEYVRIATRVDDKWYEHARKNGHRNVAKPPSLATGSWCFLWRLERACTQGFVRLANVRNHWAAGARLPVQTALPPPLQCISSLHAASGTSIVACECSKRLGK